MAATTDKTDVVYQLNGTLLEACSCGVLCPCWIGEDPDGGACDAFNAYHFDRGTIRGVEDVSGLNFVRVVHIPGNVLTPASWKQVVDQSLRVESTATAWTSAYTSGQHIVVPLKNGEGGYVADDETLTGSRARAGWSSATSVTTRTAPTALSRASRNERGNVVGLMPHPEHATEELTGPTTDGLGFFTSVLTTSPRSCSGF